METHIPDGTDALRRSIAGLLTTKHLQSLTRSLIEAHRSGNAEGLLACADKAGVADNSSGSRPRNLFYRLVQLVHPDRLPLLEGRFQAAIGVGDRAELERLHNLLSLKPESIPRKSPARYEYEEQREHHLWDEEEWPIDGWADEETRWEDSDDLSFLDAVKLDAAGTMDIDISPYEFSQLDGTLDVSRCGLFDLQGAELCTHITVLDASWNRLTSLRELASLDGLIELYLGGNGIDDISTLTGLASLEVLDLEGNEIEDASPLLEIPSLVLVNLRGNPVENKAVLRNLREAGVMVLF